MKGKIGFLALLSLILATLSGLLIAQVRDLNEGVRLPGDEIGIGLPPGDDFDPEFMYAAKFVCGFNPESTERILPGLYATAINIHNPSDGPVMFSKKIALTFPPAAQEPGPVSEAIWHALGPDQALEVDCGEIPSEFFPGVQFPPYVKGFLVVKSDRSLNVTAVYTAGAPSDPNLPILLPPTIDVDRIEERRIGDGDEDSDD